MMEELDHNLTRIRNAVEAKIAREIQSAALEAVVPDPRLPSTEIGEVPVTAFEKVVASEAAVAHSSPVQGDTAMAAAYWPDDVDDVQAVTSIESGHRDSPDHNFSERDQSFLDDGLAEQDQVTPEAKNLSALLIGELEERADERPQDDIAENPSDSDGAGSREIAIIEPSVWSKFKRFIGLE